MASVAVEGTGIGVGVGVGVEGVERATECLLSMDSLVVRSLS